MMLIKPAHLDDPNFFENSRANIENFPNTFLVGCRLYQQSYFDKATECFRKIIEGRDKTLHYEARFNLGSCLFKMAEFEQALKQFTTLLKEQKEAAKFENLSKE